MATASFGRRAVVVGAGIGGLTAARVLAERFEEVIVLERDALPSTATFRPGTPQARHAHLLLLGGQYALCELFSGFDQDIVKAGAVAMRTGLDFRVEHPGYDPFPQRDLGGVSYSASRPLIEFAIRQRVEQYANITIRQRCRARELVATPDGSVVVAVIHQTDQGHSETLRADFVIDASGRGTLTLDLLTSIGRSLPVETVLNIDVGYASAMFAIPKDAPSAWKGVMTMPQAPESGRGVLLLPIEGNQWLVTLAGRHGEIPSGDGDGFIAYAKGLRTTTVYDAIKHATRQSEVTRYKLSASVLRTFDSQRFPRRLLPLGDAICRFNPVYGQGTSVAAQQASLLRRVLDALAAEQCPLDRVAEMFLADVRGLVETPWALAAILDLAYPLVGAKRPAYFETARRFQVGLLRVAAADPAVHKLLLEVQNLLKPRSAYNDPVLARRVMAASSNP